MSRLEKALAELAAALREELRAELAAVPDTGAMLTIGAAAERIGMSAGFIRDAIADARLPAKHAGRSVRVAAADVDALLIARPRRARPAKVTATATPRELAVAIDIGRRR